MTTDYLVPRIYHFRPDKDDRDLETALESSLYFASVDSFNDPFECSASTSADANHYWNNSLDSLRQAVSSSGVCCFCRSFSNPLLWSHYADSHTGFALGISRPALEERFRPINVRDVLYEDAVPSLDDFGWMDMSLVMLCTKPTCWSYEQEVRVIRTHGDNETVGKGKLDPTAIREVIFGLSMSEERRKTFVDRFRSHGDFDHIKFAAMEKVEGRYGVQRVWLTTEVSR